MGYPQAKLHHNIQDVWQLGYCFIFISMYIYKRLDLIGISLLFSWHWNYSDFFWHLFAQILWFPWASWKQKAIYYMTVLYSCEVICLFTNVNQGFKSWRKMPQTSVGLNVLCWLEFKTWHNILRATSAFTVTCCRKSVCITTAIKPLKALSWYFACFIGFCWKEVRTTLLTCQTM